MFGFQHGKVAFAEGELPDILLCHPGDLSPNDVLHACFKGSHRFADLFLRVVRQRGVLGLLLVLRGKMVFPDPANPSVIAFALKGFVDVGGGDLPAELFRQGFTGFDDLLIGIDGVTRHVILLCS